MEKKLFSETVFRIFLSDYLLQKFGKGFLVTNLKQMRQFYLTYANDTISQTVSDPFEHLPTVSTGRKFFLSWSHYLKLMRCFYSVYLHDRIGETVFTRLMLSKDYAQIFASKYETVLPKKEDLQKLLEEQLSEDGGEDD